MPTKKKPTDAAPRTVLVPLRITPADAELIDAAARLDSRNRVDFIRHYGMAVVLDAARGIVEGAK